MKNPRIGCWLIVLLFVSLCGCDKDGVESGNKKVAFVAGAATDMWTIAKAGCDKADSELPNIDVEFRFTSNGTAAEQKSMIDDLMVKGIDGLVFTPLDPDNQSLMVNELAASIPVIITDSDAAGSDRLCYIGTNNVNAGKEAGKLVKEILPDGGEIVIFVGKTDAQNAKERIQGLQEELNGTSIKILDIRTDNLDYAVARSNVSETLIKSPEVDCLVGLWSYNGSMILEAVKDANLLGKINIVAFDEEEAVLDGVEKGYIYATVVQQPFEFGYQSIKLISSYLEGHAGSIPEDGVIEIPTAVIKQEQAGSFMSKMKEIRKL